MKSCILLYGCTVKWYFSLCVLHRLWEWDIISKPRSTLILSTTNALPDISVYNTYSSTIWASRHIEGTPTNQIVTRAKGINTSNMSGGDGRESQTESERIWNDRWVFWCRTHRGSVWWEVRRRFSGVWNAAGIKWTLFGSTQHPHPSQLPLRSSSSTLITLPHLTVPPLRVHSARTTPRQLRCTKSCNESC